MFLSNSQLLWWISVTLFNYYTTYWDWFYKIFLIIYFILILIFLSIEAYQAYHIVNCPCERIKIFSWSTICYYQKTFLVMNLWCFWYVMFDIWMKPKNSVHTSKIKSFIRIEFFLCIRISFLSKLTLRVTFFLHIYVRLIFI